MTEPKRPVALVTGGRRGIGLGIVLALAGSGFDVAFIGVSEPSSESDALVAELAKSGATAAYFKSDIADPASHTDVVSQVVSQLAALIASSTMPVLPPSYAAIIWNFCRKISTKSSIQICAAQCF